MISDPLGIDCGLNCSAAFPSGTKVTLTATVSSDGVFTGWAGECSGTGTCTSMIGGAQTVSAAFTCAGSKQFAYTGSTQTFKTPACASNVIIDASGAQGGNAGGKGARIQGTFAKSTLTSPDLVVVVGGAGTLSIANGGGGGRQLRTRWRPGGATGQGSGATGHGEAAGEHVYRLT